MGTFPDIFVAYANAAIKTKKEEEIHLAHNNIENITICGDNEFSCTISNNLQFLATRQHLQQNKHKVNYLTNIFFRIIYYILGLNPFRAVTEEGE